MLSYPLPEAEVLLQEKLVAAKESLENCEEDLDYLRQQITVRSPSPPELNQARQNAATHLVPCTVIGIYIATLLGDGG